MTAYYNEIDPYAAQWLRNLIAAGHIAPGDVDERSIEDVRPGDLSGYTQCHFFAGIGIWSLALRRAGWPDDRPAWTGSCPCQPFSAAGKRGGVDDERHLWPAWFHLVQQCEPSVVFGEQVASKDGLGWLDLVQADLETAGYASGAFDICAAGVGAPHIRQRLWFVAERMEYAALDGRIERRAEPGERGALPGCGAGGLADSTHQRLDGSGDARSAGRVEYSVGGGSERMADDASNGRREECKVGGGQSSGDRAQGLPAGSGAGSGDRRPGPVNGFWRDADWLFFRDGKWRPVEGGTFPLADGDTARVGRLRAYGNAIVAQAAQTFIEAYQECRNLR